MRWILLTVTLLIATSIPGGALGQPAISSEIAPLGKLRVAVNSRTPVLLTRTSDGKITGGVAFEVGKFIAEKLGVSFEVVAYANSKEHTQSFGTGAEIMARITERELLSLKAPIKRVTGYDVPTPYPKLEDYYLPNVSRVTKAIQEVMKF